MQKRRRGFSMIELIVIIMVIGILAMVAIPKLTASRDDAEAAVCVQEVDRLIKEISSHYQKVGFNEFKNTSISKISNVTVSSHTARGFQEDGTLHDASLEYLCDGEKIVKFSGSLTSSEATYKLSIQTLTGSTPASNQAILAIKKNILNGKESKAFKL